MSDRQPSITILESQWDGIEVKYCHLKATGDFSLAMPQNGISIAFAPHDRATWSVGRGTSQTTPVAPGSIFIHANRDFIWHYREKESEWLDLQLESDVLSRIAEESGLSSNLELEHCVLFSDPTILHLARLFQTEVIKSGVAETIYIESLRNLLAVHLIRNYSSVESRSLEKLNDSIHPLDSLQIKELKDYIEENLANKLSLEKLAAIVHLNQFYFVRAFKQALGITPHHYIIHRRLERAKILLSVTQFSIREIAMQVGYRNQSHFTTQFRKCVGASPKVYRNSFK